MPANIIFRNLTVPPRLGVNPLFSTAAAKRDGSREVTPDNPTTPAGLFFADDFNAQADWNGSQNGIIEQYADQGHILPTGWDAARSTVGWAASAGYPGGFETMYIKSGAEFTRSGTGKAFVHYRSGREASAFWTDGILSKKLPAGTKKVFTRFWIKFQNGWTNRGLDKLFRIQGWDEGQNYWNGSSLQPSFIWTFYQSNYGSRFQITRRSESPDFNFPDEPLIDTRADGSLSWSADTYDLNDDNVVDNDPQLIDQITGGVIPYDQFRLVDHSEFMGDGWHKVEMYVEMNTAPGAYDGKLVMWMDDSLIFRNLVMPWIQSSGNPDKDWRTVKLGGNDSWNLTSGGAAPITDTDRRQEWYAIDEVEIYTGGLPEGMTWLTQ
jgi:hypothetical protein